jgi:hypothetical protein
MRELSQVFPPTTLSYLIEIKAYNYFTLITLIVYNRQMRAMLKICVTIPKTFKSTDVSPGITLMCHPFEIQNIFKMCDGAYLVVLRFALSCDAPAS